MQHDSRPHREIRDTLFGDLPFSEWPHDGADCARIEPWLSFTTARAELSNNNEATAKQILHGILAMQNLESRHYLQAWTFLRALNEQPAGAQAKFVYGVVVEVTLEQGLDIVAAYADLTARYFNYSGAAIIWERPNDSLNQYVEALLQAGKIVAEQIGPMTEPRGPAPPAGQARISMLTPSGIHFGQASLEVLAADSRGGRVMGAAAELMMRLIAMTQEPA